jgi:hypothetical protein
MIDDPIVEEVRAHRQAHAARFNYDLAAIVADLIEREKNSSRPVVNRPPRRVPERVIGSGEERTASIA